MSVLRRPDIVDLRTLTETWRIRRDTEGLPAIPGRRGNVSAHDLTTLCVYAHGRHYLLKLRASAHRDQPDRSIVITRIGRS